ncbi:MAG: tetratricopeptide repeat protein [Gammaproteobacteria bacterium]|nr:tetratricopeptide repeat protein [Gammaproteobacteria bacterium]
MFNRKHIKTIVFVPVVSLAILLLGACSTSNKGEMATLGSLQKRAIKITPQKLPTANKSDARQRYKDFAKNTDNQELRAIALERLADIQLESREEQDTLAVEQRRDKLETIEGTNAPVDEDLGDYSNVAKQYERLLARYPKGRDNEKILYQLARAYDLSGQNKKSLKVLDRIVKEYPDTKHVEEVQFRRGEIYFSFKDYKNASRAYGYVLSNRDSKYYERSLYKHGWSLFKVGRLEQARFSFYKLLDLHFDGGGHYDNFSRSDKELMDDTLRVVSLSYSFQDNTKTIREFSKLYGWRKYEHRIYQGLGNLYLKQERFEDAANAFKAFAAAYPKSREAPKFLVQVINIYEKGGFTNKLTVAKSDFVTTYAIGKAYWSRHDRQLLDDISPFIKSNLDDLARHYHAKAQKSKKTNDYNAAAHWYREYVRSFPADTKAAEMNFLLAEILLETKDYANAAIEYEKTAYNYSANTKSAEAGYAALLAHQKIIDTLAGDRRAAKRHQTVDSSLRFAKAFPGDQRTPSVLLKTSEELLDLKRIGEASATAKQVLKLDASVGISKAFKASAWAIIASAEFGLGNHIEAEQASMARLQLSATNDKDRKVHSERLAAAIYKQGEQARAKGEYREAAKHFLRVGDLAPDSSVRPVAEYDAAAALAEISAWKQNIMVLSRFVRDFPTHKFVKDATEKLAFAYEKTGNWAQAAQTYDTIYAGETNPERKRALLWQIAEFYEKAGKQSAAADIYTRYVKYFNEPIEQSIEARQKVADIYKKRGNHKKRKQLLLDIVKTNDGGQATERTRFLAASAALELAEPTYQLYRNIHLVLPLKKNLKKKKAAMQKCIEAYTKAANYGVAAVTTASTYRIAEVYNDFSRGLFASQRPVGLSPTELEQYGLLLEEQAFPFEEKAIEIHETNAGRVKTGVYDQWVKKSFIALRKLRPVRYAKLERSELFDVAIE